MITKIQGTGKAVNGATVSAVKVNSAIRDMQKFYDGLTANERKGLYRRKGIFQTALDRRYSDRACERPYYRADYERWVNGLGGERKC